MIGASGRVELKPSFGDRPLIHDLQRAWWGANLDQRGGAPAVNLMLVYRSATGLNVPISFFLVRRTDGRTWDITGIVLANVGAEAGVGTHALAQPPY